MKKTLTSVTALLLLIWYSFSIIGFDVHTCNSSGEVYIATVVSGFSCEDIHPDHQHGRCGCHKHARTADEPEGIHTGMKSCCTGDFQVIMLTGTRSSDSSHERVCISPVSALIPQTDISQTFHTAVSFFYKPRPGTYVSRDTQAFYSIWRS